MSMTPEAYAQLLAYESTQRSIYASQREGLALVVQMFVQHLYIEHKLGYRQIGKRLGMKWTRVKEIMEKDNDKSKSSR